jgi:hypothetical protein
MATQHLAGVFKLFLKSPLQKLKHSVAFCVKLLFIGAMLIFYRNRSDLILLSLDFKNLVKLVNYVDFSTRAKTNRFTVLVPVSPTPKPALRSLGEEITILSLHQRVPVAIQYSVAVGVSSLMILNKCCEYHY